MRKLFFIFILIDLCVSQEIPELKLSLARNGHSVTTLQEYNLVFFAGGRTELYTTHETIDVLNITSFSWDVIKLSLGRTEIGSTSLNNHGLVFFAGGQYFTKDTNSVVYIPIVHITNIIDIYDVKNKMFKTAYLSVNRSSISATSLEKEGLVFFAGGRTHVKYNFAGFENIYSNIIDIYDANQCIWSTAQLSFPNAFITGVSFNSLGLFIAGGGLGTTLDIYNSSSKIWTKYTITSQRIIGTSISLEKFGIIFIAGGALMTDVSISIDLVEIIDVVNKKTTLN